MLGEVLYTIIHNGLRYVVNTDHLCDFKLWIKVYDGDNMICNSFMWMLHESGRVLDDGFWTKYTWKDAVGFSWRDMEEVHPGLFPEDTQKRLDSYFKLKAFW
jgi:hypothetical protein